MKEKGKTKLEREKEKKETNSCTSRRQVQNFQIRVK